MAVVEIEEVTLVALDRELLWGGYIDQPKAGSQNSGHMVDIWGWVLGRNSRAVAVEIMHDGAVIQRVPVQGYRPDLTHGFPHVPEAERAGFRTTVSVLGMSELSLQVQAVLQDQRRVPLGAIRARRRWRDDTTRTDAALVSVIIPCYNQAHFLAEAIESVLAQTYPHFEIVVVDDGSTDNTEAVAARYPGVRCIQQQNQGLSAARNTGLRQSNGRFLVFLDADDRLMPDALAVGLACFQNHPESAFVAGHYRHIKIDGTPLAEFQPHGIEKEHYTALLQHNYIIMHATVMYRREVFESVVGFDTSLKACEDYDLYLRIARNFPIYCHDKLVAEYRRHGANMSGNAALMLKSEGAVRRSQRKYVKGNKLYKEAYKAGLKRLHEGHGELLVSQVLDQIVKRQWKQALSGMRVLRQYYPQGLAAILSPDPLPPAQLEALWQQIDELTATKGAAESMAAQLQQIVAEQAAQLEAFAAQVEYLAGREAELQAQLLEACDELQYLHLTQRIREIACSILPSDVTVMVVSKGDEALLQLDGRPAWHFPRTADGVYAGYYPADSEEAIAQLEALRAKGAEYLIFPMTAFWWLEHYAEFKQHLEERYPVLVHQEDTCLIFALQERVGQVALGSLRRVTPVSRVFGYDRGRPVDRYYIENFLARQADDIRGRVLEIGDDSYTRMFGDGRVTTSDVLHVVAGNPGATFVGDLTSADHIPSDTFDCVILTQTLHLIYDVRAAIQTLHRILKPGGVLLATFPGISQLSRDEWRNYWCWSFTKLSARRLFEEVFAVASVTIEAHGNVLAAIAFLEGLAVEELRREELDYHDPDYELLITLRATKLDTADSHPPSESRIPNAVAGPDAIQTVSMASLYPPVYHMALEDSARQSAQQIVPIVLEFVQPTSVIDVGCSLGTWLGIFKQFGVTDVLGIDGDYMDRSMLRIAQDEFMAFDLRSPLRLDRTFDLVMSLEVAEHLPAACAESFVDSLTSLGPVVLFSAAIPDQEGTGHINEQWPHYWVQLFEQHGYVVVDCLRKRIWDDELVAPWYAQNILTFVNRGQIGRYPLLQQALIQTETSKLAMVHPRIQQVPFIDTALSVPQSISCASYEDNDTSFAQYATLSTNDRRDPGQSRALILLYHRVAELPSDPWSLSVTPHHFAEHLEILRKHAYPLQLQQLNQALLNGDLPQRSVIITFDDGYVDNLHNAKPMLEQYDIPATFFLASGYIGHEREFWWDDLARLLLEPGTLPETLLLRTNGRTHEWNLAEAAHYSPDAYQCHSSWKAWEDAPGGRQVLYRTLYDLLCRLVADERRQILNDLLTWAGAEATSRPTHRPLSLEEAVTLAQGELIEIGAHTVTHPVLSALSLSSQQNEIQESKTHLEEILGYPVTTFAYPYGNRSDYTVDTVGLVREVGFICACSAFAGIVERSTGQFQLPRVYVGDWDGEEFNRQLSDWFDRQ